jgi:geranylgeranylglycerol-phosphate geranylgeranyltransferase
VHKEIPVMRKIAALILLVRPLNILITAIAIAVGYIISTETISLFIIVSAALSGSFTAAAGNIVNDLFDVDTDKINHPERPLAGNLVTYNSAKIIWFFLTLSSFILASLVDMYAFIIILSVHILLILYSFRLKSTIITGNVVISFLTASAFLYGGYAAGNIKNTIIPAIFAFLINYARELIKDMEDVKGDLSSGIVTLPGKYGVKNTKKIIFTFIIALFLFTFYPFITGYYKIEFFLIMMLIINPILVYIIKILFESDDVKMMRKISGLLKINMIIGIISIYIGQ